MSNYCGNFHLSLLAFYMAIIYFLIFYDQPKWKENDDWNADGHIKQLAYINTVKPLLSGQHGIRGCP